MKKVSPKKIHIGDTIKAHKIPGRSTLLDTPEDVRWAMEVHLKQFGLLPFTAMILVGNEDSPDALYGTKVREPKFDSQFVRLL